MIIAVVRNLILAGHDVHVVTGAPDFVFTIKALALEYPETAVKPRESILATEIEWLNSIKADLVVSDVVPVACRAAADAGIRSVCVTNSSKDASFLMKLLSGVVDTQCLGHVINPRLGLIWDFMYAEYVMAAGNHHRSIVWQEHFLVALKILIWFSPVSVPAFRDVIDVPLVVLG
ncbi:hypothetical protein DKX38_027561 [Salix brachista]|uniref:Uncharacterized protein n=1 Tax=Salix brachista TaxID=2182728 RepID=A0A5N5J891_9ROSI|nr:hypothetical protein DKX38_027561 [Salix brachista]